MDRKVRQRPLRVLSRKTDIILVVSFFAVVSSGLIWFIYDYGNVGSPVFWAAAVIEVILAFLTFVPKSSALRLILMVGSIAIPRILETNVSSLSSLKTVFAVYGLACLWIGIYKKYRPKKHKPRVKPLVQEFTFPRYLPSGFQESDRKQYKRKGYQAIELVYGNDDVEYLIWIKESNGPIPDYEPRKGMQISEKIINEIPVHIEQEILKPTSKQSRRVEPSFIEANWSHKGINFNLRSDGLFLDEAEKVIVSMIQ